MEHRILVYRIALLAVGIWLAIRKVARYRAARRTGDMPYDPRFGRAGKLAAIAAGLFLTSFVLLPLRIGLGWPRWLAYLFFAPLVLSLPIFFYAALLFGRAGWGGIPDPAHGSRTESPGERQRS
jgi:hypothetical protein